MGTPRCAIAVFTRNTDGSIDKRTQCQETGIYKTEFADCATCRVQLGILWCIGHQVCIEHAAKFRADRYKFVDDPVDAVVGRMSADYA